MRTMFKVVNESSSHYNKIGYYYGVNTLGHILLNFDDCTSALPFESYEVKELSNVKENVMMEQVAPDCAKIKIDPNGKMRCENKTIKQLTKKNTFDAGLDICSNEDRVILPRSSALISTGLFIAVPQWYVGMIKSRSGLSIKSQIEVGAGVIDSDYRGEIKVHLYNHGDHDFVIYVGDRIAQLLTIPINIEKYELVEELDETDRGEKGFGSSGVRNG